MKRYIIIIFLLPLTIFLSLPSYSQKKTDEPNSFKIFYMGTVEGGHIFPWSHFLKVTHGVVTLTTIHGVQVRPWLFTGAGFGGMMLYHKDGIGMDFPLYVNGRFTLPYRHFQPFFDFKFGISFFPSSFNFFNPSIGYKYAWGKKGGVRLSIGANIFTSASLKKYNGVSAIIGFDF